MGGQALREYSAHLGWNNYRDNIYRGGTLLATVASAAAGGTTKHLNTDHLGTPRLITDAAGNPATAQFHAYYPYGSETIESSWEPPSALRRRICATRTQTQSLP